MIVDEKDLKDFHLYTKEELKQIRKMEQEQNNFQFGKDNIPRLVDGERYLKFIETIKEMDTVGYLEVDITDRRILEKLRVPEKLYEFCAELEIPLENAINTILRDFIVRYYSGTNKYDKGILTRIRKCNLTVNQKKRTIKSILQEFV